VDGPTGFGPPAAAAEARALAHSSRLQGMAQASDAAGNGGSLATNESLSSPPSSAKPNVFAVAAEAAAEAWAEAARAGHAAAGLKAAFDARGSAAAAVREALAWKMRSGGGGDGGGSGGGGGSGSDGVLFGSGGDDDEDDDGDDLSQVSVSIYIFLKLLLESQGHFCCY